MTIERIKFWDEIADEFAGTGSSLTDIAEETGEHLDTIRSAMDRRLVTLTPNHVKTIRQRVQSMRPLEAVEYLLDVIEKISWVHLEVPHPTDCIKVAKSPKRLLRALYDADGGVLCKDNLLTVCTVDYRTEDEEPQTKIVDIYICKLRAALVGSPWKIETVWGVGYYLTDAGPAGRT